MTNTETSDKAAPLAEQGAHVAPEKASSKKSATKKRGAPKAKKGCQGCQSQGQAGQPKGTPEAAATCDPLRPMDTRLHAPRNTGFLALIP